MTNETSLNGKIVVVTEVTSDLSRIIIKQLLKSGAVVAAVHKDEEEFRDLKAFAGETDHSLISFQADLTSESQIEETIDDVLTRYKKIDALINLVGIDRSVREVGEKSESEWNEMFRANLESSLRLSRAVLPAMIKSGSGRIISISARPIIEDKVRTKSGTYAVSKAWVIVTTDAVAGKAVKRGETAEPNSSQRADPEEIAKILLLLVSNAAADANAAAPGGRVRPHSLPRVENTVEE